jgi:hypothetical protein
MSNYLIPVGIITLSSFPCLWVLACGLHCLIAGPSECRAAMICTIGAAIGVLASIILWLVAILATPHLFLIITASVVDLLLALALLLREIGMIAATVGH